MFGAICSIVGGLGLFIITPNNTNLDLVIYILCQLVYSLGLGVYSTVSWAMMGDAIDYNEWKFGTREEGTVYSLHSFFRKLAQGIGPSIVLLIMGWLGYASKLGTIGQSPETAKNMCWLVAGLYLFSAVLQFVGITFIYNLDKKKVAQMTEELSQRRVTAQETVAVENAPEVPVETVETTEDTPTDE